MIKELSIEHYRFDVSACGKTIINVWTGRKLAQCACKNGYLRVWSGGSFNKRRSFSVHRLVALTWLDCPKNYEKLDINHKDLVKNNNHVNNLEWMTRSENRKHAWDNGKQNNFWEYRYKKNA